MRSRKKLSYWIFKISISFIIGFFLILSLIFINPLSELKNIITLDLSADTLLDILWFFIIGWCILEFSLLISRLMERFIPWEISPRKRFVVQLIIQCIAVVALLTTLIFIADLVLSVDNEPLEESDIVGFRQILFISIVLSIIVTAGYSGEYLVNKWKASLLETATLKQIVLESQLQSLKLQLDPHFLFNNFSTLSSLISENQDMAQEFLESLSQVHRYMLFNLDKNVVPLKSELEFIEAYIYLIKIRFRDNLDIQIDPMDEVDYKGLPPISLQILIENAVKHNIASRKNPLKIRVYLEKESIVVSNNLQKLPNLGHSSKIGLRNIIDRYRLLSDKKPLISETDQEFIVKLPLLDLNA